MFANLICCCIPCYYIHPCLTHTLLAWNKVRFCVIFFGLYHVITPFSSFLSASKPFRNPPAAFLFSNANLFLHKQKTKGSGREAETKCNFKAAEGGWHKAQQLRGCAHDWCPWGDDEFIQTEATQQSLIKRENSHARSILNANAMNCGCVCAGNSTWLQTVISGGVSGEGERMPLVFLLSSEHVALLTHWLTSNCSIQSPSHAGVKALDLLGCLLFLMQHKL